MKHNDRETFFLPFYFVSRRMIVNLYYNKISSILLSARQENTKQQKLIFKKTLNELFSNCDFTELKIKFNAAFENCCESSDKLSAAVKYIFLFLIFT